MVAPRRTPEDLADRLLAEDAKMEREFASVSEPDPEAEAEIRRERYVAIIRDWMA